MTPAEGGKRLAYMDALRIAAAFLVVVNHTVSRAFMPLEPNEPQWWLLIVWYYLSKLAVPLFVMISGACLLGRVDSYAKSLWRAARVVIATLIFAYAFFLYDAWVNYGLWPRAADFGEFFSRVWNLQILDDFWYINMYVGLMLMLPCLQRMAERMGSKDVLYLAGMSLGLGGAWRLAAHYLPQLAPPPYFDAPLFSVFIGCFFMGYWIRQHLTVSRKTLPTACALLALALASSAALTYLEAGATGAGKSYLFMDERTAPSIFMLLSAACAMAIGKALGGRQCSPRKQSALRELGGCAFSVYLMQGFIILQTGERVYQPLLRLMPPVCAALLWELLVFALSLGVAWVLRRVPIIKKVL